MIGANNSSALTQNVKADAKNSSVLNLDTAQGGSPLGAVEFDVPFSNGLTIVIDDAVGVTVIYE